MPAYPEERRFGVLLWMVVSAAITLVCVLVCIVCVRWSTVAGNELGVMETWNCGVVNASFPSKTYWLFPSMTKKMYVYDLSPKLFLMSDQPNGAHEHGREKDAYRVKSADNQPMTFEMQMQWRFDPKKIIDLHKQYHCYVGTDAEEIIEERLLRPVVQKAANTEATARKAIEAYSGGGFVQLQAAIEKQLTDPAGELRQQGIIVEQFVVQQITLDEAYIGEINKRQVAEQRKLRIDKETEAANAEALKAKAEAQSDFEKQVVESKRKKEQAILQSEGEAQTQVNAAKAAAERVTVAAEAEAKAGTLKAQAILALGQAEAQATKLKMEAYNAAGSENFVRMEVAKSVAEGFKGVQGYLPADMKINLLSSNFMDAVAAIMGKRVSETAQRTER